MEWDVDCCPYNWKGVGTDSGVGVPSTLELSDGILLTKKRDGRKIERSRLDWDKDDGEDGTCREKF